jgi:phospho-N-acetylmuramoyl-pentapeptide-transferase
LFSPLNVFRYITFRTSLAVLTAMLFSLIFGPWIIKRLKKLSLTQHIRDDGPKAHMGKEGTPTMGGLLIIICILLSILMWGDLKNIYIWIIIVSLIGFGGIGFVDDYLRFQKVKRSQGIPEVWPADNPGPPDRAFSLYESEGSIY